MSIDDAPPLEVLDAPLERVETIDAVWRAVEELNPDLKMALLLRDVVGLSYTEIADSLEITLATVKWRIYKAREEVQLALAREGITLGDARRAARRRLDASSRPQTPVLAAGRRAARADRASRISACVALDRRSRRGGTSAVPRLEVEQGTPPAGRRRAAGRPSRG